MAMFTIEDIVSSAFSDASFGLEATELVEMVHVVTLQVDSLLAQYHAEHHDEPAIPVQSVTSGLALVACRIDLIIHSISC